MTSSEAISAIKQELFSVKIEKKKSVRTSKLKKIVSLLLDIDLFYLLAEKGTSYEDWQNGSFLPDTSEKQLIVFLDEEDVPVYAQKNGFMSGDQALYGCVPIDALLGILQMFQEQKSVTSIRVYPRMPLCIDIPVELLNVDLPNHSEQELAVPEEEPAESQTDLTVVEETEKDSPFASSLPPSDTGEQQIEKPVPMQQGMSIQAEFPNIADSMDDTPNLPDSSSAPISEIPDPITNPEVVGQPFPQPFNINEAPVPLNEPIPSEVTDTESEEADMPALQMQVFSMEPQDPAVRDLVKEIQSCLDKTENRLRKQIDPGLVYNNVHSLIGKLLFANPKVDIYKLESTLGLPGGFLPLYTKDKVSSSISKQKLVALLNYYGLAPYTYQFKKYCNDLRTELRDSDMIDVCDIRAASVHTKETFELLEINRGTTQDGFYVYGLRFKSTFRVVDLISSTPLGFVVGKHYELFNLPPLSESSQEIPESRALEEAVPSYPRERSVEEVLMDSVIAYFKREESATVKEAKQKYAALSKHPDIQMEFAKYTQTGRPGKIKVREYSANYLIHTLKFTPYEAYIKLCELRDEPAATMQFLKYRERDPQYKKPKKKGGTA